MITVHAQVKNSEWLMRFLRNGASPLLTEILNNPGKYRYQLIYTKIDRDKKNLPHFTNYYCNVDKDNYFFPASTVKLPTALAALEKVHTLGHGVTAYTAMLTDSARPSQTAAHTDSTAPGGLPSIAHYIKKIFIVSDNDAYNRLYEFTGQQQLNESLRQKGYHDTRITRRFVRMTPDENRYTNPIRFMDQNKLLYAQPEAHSDISFDFSKKVFIGKGYLDADEKLVNKPMEFTLNNNLPLDDLRQLLQTVLFPQTVAPEKRFKLTKDDYNMLYHYMSEWPSESGFPKYDSAEFFDSYTKFFFLRDGKQHPPPHLRIFNKAGWSYGFLTDVCYIVDFKNNVEFMLAGTVYVNDDEILNDDKYDYETKGYPFFREVGEKMYQYELKRKRAHQPDFSRWKFEYE